MFGTIGHARMKSAAAAKEMTALTDEWKRTIRPQIPGPVLELMGTVSGHPDQVVFVALVQDEQTYRALANNPDQDKWYRRMVELMDGDVTWEDVNLDLAIND